ESFRRGQPHVQSRLACGVGSKEHAGGRGSDRPGGQGTQGIARGPYPNRFHGLFQRIRQETRGHSAEGRQDGSDQRGSAANPRRAGKRIGGCPYVQAGNIETAEGRGLTIVNSFTRRSFSNG